MIAVLLRWLLIGLLLPWSCCVLSNSTSPAARHREWTIMLGLNSGFEDMFHNWWGHFHRLKLPNPVVVIAEDLPIATKLRHLQLPHVTVMRSTLSNPDHADYGSSAFKHMMSQRPQHLLRLLESGRSLFFTDVDTVWLSSPLQHLVGNYSVYLVWDGGPPDNFCGGIMGIRSSGVGVTLVREWQKRLRAGAGPAQPGNQVAFNLVVSNLPRASVVTLPNSAFPTAKQYFGVAGGVSINQSISQGVSVVHNNWIVGKDKKIQRWKEFGLWNLTGHVQQLREVCCDMQLNHRVEIGRSWGSLPLPQQIVWSQLNCDALVQARMRDDGGGGVSTAHVPSLANGTKR